MPLEPYKYQPSTPKSNSPSPKLPGSSHSRHASGSSSWSSPESAITHATTPNVSPLRGYGPCLLPQIRTQDQHLEPQASRDGHSRRALSQELVVESPDLAYRPHYQRSTTSPPDFSSNLTSTSTTSSIQSENPSHRHLGHARSISTPTVEGATLRRACPPTYRSLPVYITHQSPQYTPAVVPGLEDFVSIAPASNPHPLYRELTPELLVETGNEPTSTIGKFLTEPNPALNLVPTHYRGYGDGSPKHCWWDIRNLRTWGDFRLDAISSVEILNGLLNVPVNAAALPRPAPLSTTGANPQDLQGLANTIENFHASKVNAALKITQGNERHLSMQHMRNAQDGSFFISNWANDREASLSGNGRGRVVGLVKPYEQWNTGKRNVEKRDEKCQDGVEYLRHLAHLQVLMRAHNCRYGFIVTEIELVCVRMGTEEGAPYFGMLELSDPIPMKNHHSTTSLSARHSDPRPDQLTACLALWYLSMLAGESVLPGQYGWKIEVGPPAGWTRSKVLKSGLEGRDKWMPKVTLAETRHACTLRGWAWPEDRVHRAKEGVVGGRAGRKG